MNKRTIIVIFILVLIGLGCIEASKAFIEEADYKVIGVFRPQGIRQAGELQGEVFRIHDDELNVTLYIYRDGRGGGGGMAAVPDSQLGVNT
jgi:hypothetical protein